MRPSSSFVAASVIALATAQTTSGTQTTSASTSNASAQAGSEILSIVTSVQSGAAFSSIAVVHDGQWNAASASAADTALAQLVFNGGTATTTFFASIPTDAAVQTFYKSVASQEMAVMSKYSLLPSQKSTATSSAAATSSATSNYGNGTASSTGGNTGSGTSDGIIGSGGSGTITAKMASVCGGVLVGLLGIMVVL
ncbi:hypothetical protein B7494_g5360 [Chlorociboria aeruginascens]|nr:hypothetical protein B7494_g5360 [Chlorociboria aeruginascens]